MKAYEGNEKYIFISYAHKDSEIVLPILEKMQKAGFRIWYDEGIEAGTEWPEYIADHLDGCEVVLVFMSNNSANSQNCRNEINFALKFKKEVLILYVEETTLTRGLELQIGTLQSLFKYRHQSEESFMRELIEARLLKSCREERAFAPAVSASPKAISCPCCGNSSLNYIRITGDGFKCVLCGIWFESPAQGKKADAVTEEDKAEMMAKIEAELRAKIMAEMTSGTVEKATDEEKPAEATESTEEDAPAFIEGKGEDGLIVYKDGTTEVLRYGITEIKENAYKGNKKIVSVTLPESIKAIGNAAFSYCSFIEKAEIPNGVTSIGERAFEGCWGIKTVDIPESVKNLGSSVFSYCRNLEYIAIPEGVTEISSFSFNHCQNLKKITIPQSVTAIGSYAFDGCTKLKDVYYGGSEKDWKKIKIGMNNKKLTAILGRANIRYK